MVAASSPAGCGGGEDSTTPRVPDAPSSARADYVVAADRVCAENAPLREQAVEDPSESGEAARAQLSSRAKLDTRLRALTPPPELAADVATFHDQTARVIGLLREEIVLAESPGAFDDERIERFNAIATRVSRALIERERTAARIGFSVCGAAEAGPSLSSPAGGAAGAPGTG